VNSPIIEKLELTKGQFRFAVSVGLTLGAMSILILSFIMFEKTTMTRMNLEKQNKHDLIKELGEKCGERYNKISGAVFENRMEFSCEDTLQ